MILNNSDAVHIQTFTCYTFKRTTLMTQNLVYFWENYVVNVQLKVCISIGVLCRNGSWFETPWRWC